MMPRRARLALRISLTACPIDTVIVQVSDVWSIIVKKGSRVHASWAEMNSSIVCGLHSITILSSQATEPLAVFRRWPPVSRPVSLQSLRAPSLGQSDDGVAKLEVITEKSVLKRYTEIIPLKSPWAIADESARSPSGGRRVLEAARLYISSRIS